MWVIGAVVVLIIGAAVTAALGWSPRETAGRPLWDIAELGGAIARSLGTFAGFSLASATFIAGLDAARTSAAFVTVFGMMLIGFLILSGTWIAGSGPKVSQAKTENAPAQSLAAVLLNLCGSLGVTITWLALAPLSESIGLLSLAGVLIWTLLIMVLAGSAWVALVAYRLTMARARACLAIPVLGVALPALYRLVAVPLWPALWPADDSALHFAFVALAAAGPMLALYLGLDVVYDNTAVHHRLRRDGDRMVLVASQVYALVVGLTWFAVALP